MNVNKASAPVSVTSPGTVTISQAAEAVIGKASHGLLAKTPVVFSVSGGGGDHLPLGITAGTVYYVSATDLNANDFKIETTDDGTGEIVGTTDAGQGTFTCTCTNEVLRLDVSSVKTVGIEVKNIGANALDLFDTVGKFSASGDEYVILTTGANYTDPAHPCIRASGSPVALAAAATFWMFLDVSGLHTLILRASSAVGATSLKIHGSLKAEL